jgi:polysaccharide chain length determinant protein (PEP-CTERM system associated)
VLPGKSYKPDDLIAIAWRRKWLVIVPFVVITIAANAWVRVLPDLYRSETLILVVPQRIPESYVRSTVTSQIEDRLPSISQQILTHTRLETIIREFDLYADQRWKPMENLVETMRKDIKVATVRGDAFTVSYVSGNPESAMKVTERLASEFITENLRDREVLADGTNAFLESQLDDARRRLTEQELKVAEYRRAHLGELPSQLESNLQVIQNTQFQVQAVVESIARDRERQLVLQRQISEAESADERLAVEPSGGGDGLLNQAAPTADRLETARGSLLELERRLTSEHPDVVAMRRTVRSLEQRLADEASRPSSAGAQPARSLTAAELAKRNRLRELRAEADGIVRLIASKQAEEQRLRDIVAAYQIRIEATPTRESELIGLTRDYNTLQQVYASFLEKHESSKVAANLERQQAGQQFKILDPARLPRIPFSPDRMKLGLIGALMGLMTGVGLVVFLEYRDTTLRTVDDIVLVLSLPVLAVVPAMVTATERARRWRQRLVLSASALTGLAVAAALAWKVVSR